MADDALPPSVADRAARVRFRRALTLMGFTLLVPGSAQLIAGNRKVGRVAVRVWLAMLAAVAVTGLLVLLHRPVAFWLVSNTHLLLLLRVTLIAAAIGWAYLFLDAWRIGRPLSLRIEHRRAVVGINGVLCFSVVATLLFGAHLVGVQRDLMITLFGSGQASDPFDGRYNVLLLGADAGNDRWGMRPDSIQVASIDEKTGRTVLVGLPRNMKGFPFPEGSVMAEQFPDGFDADFLNGVNTWARDNERLFGDSEHPGIDATVMAVEGITGMRINYWVMVNMAGFRQMVDAVGGIELDVKQRIPIGLPHDDFYSHIEPGRQQLNGFETLWFTRARHDSDDYSRMARQKCVISALAGQVSPQKALKNFSAIAEASAEMVATNIPASEVDTFLELALKARSQPIASVSLVPPAINTGNPDIEKAQAMVREAIEQSDGTAAAREKVRQRAGAEQQQHPEDVEPERQGESDAPAQVTGGSVGSLRDGYAANQAEDVAAVC